MTGRRKWVRGALAIGLLVFAAEQLWRHGHDYVLPREFAVVEEGKLYRGGWQKEWPMRRIVRDYRIRTVLALAHPPDHDLSVREKTLCDELGIRWVHIPIVDLRNEGNARDVSDLLDEAAAVLADPANQPIFFHCHHGLNRASMAQIAYRTKYCNWTLDHATDEVARTVGLIKVTHGPDYRHMVDYYNQRVLPFRHQKDAPTSAPAKLTARAEARRSRASVVR
jgi:hypothetical protein